LLATLIVGIGLGACAGPPDDTSCFQPTRERVRALAWAPGGDTLTVMTGDYASPSLSVMTVDSTTLAVGSSIEAPGALDALAVGADGAATWVAWEVDGASFLDRLDGDRVVRVGRLPHPNFRRLIATDVGLMGVETRVQAELTGPLEASRLVRITTSEGRIDVEGITEFDPATIDIAVSIDGGTVATASQLGGVTTIEVEGDVALSRVVPGGVSSVDVSRSGSLVGYRGDDGQYRVWDLDNDHEATVLDHWVSTSAMSPQGDIAVAELTDQGPSGQVCLVRVADLKFNAR
jgi:WD40 repeat protein